MTHSGGKPHAVGDRGQRFEITVYDIRKAKRIVFGWASTREGADEIAEAAVLSPNWKDAKVRDRQADSE